MRKNSDEISAALRLAQSPEGQRLLSALKAENGEALDLAMVQAAAGDTAAAQKTLSALLRSPELQAMIQDLGRQIHG